MTIWQIYGVVGATKYLGEVEAETQEQAIEKGWKLETVHCSICNHCASEVGDPQITELIAEESNSL